MTYEGIELSGSEEWRATNVETRLTTEGWDAFMDSLLKMPVMQPGPSVILPPDVYEKLGRPKTMEDYWKACGTSRS